MRNKNAALVQRQYIVPFVLIASLFFMWGFARSILDVLNKHFQDTMQLSVTESSLIQVVVYSAYFLVAIPAGIFISRRGYRRGVVMGLLLFAAGALLFIPSEWMMSFVGFLVSLFVLGSGLAFLETAANPYAATLGDPRTSASRLNLAQSLNGLGCIFGPMIGGLFILKEGGGHLSWIYAIMGVFVLGVAIVFTRVKLPEIKQDSDENAPSKIVSWSVWKSPLFTFGITALFAYEVAEISINSLFINYATADGAMSGEDAALLLSICGLGLFFLGRILGSFIMKIVRAELILTICAGMTILCTGLVIANLGIGSRVALCACYAFESIMFPTIFAMALTGLGDRAKSASSFMMMTPIGGAIGTFLMAWLADRTNMSMSFLVPMAGYAVVLAFALMALKKLNKH